MRYFGGKQRISKPLSEFLNSQLKPNQPFVDAFCGSCNVISKIDNDRIRIANDIHPELIALWKYVQRGGNCQIILHKMNIIRLKNTEKIGKEGL